MSRAVGLVASLAIVPLTIGEIGRESYGAWMAILGFVAVLGFADLGIGNAVITRVSRANAQAPSALSREVSSALALLIAVATLVVGLAVAMYVWVDAAGLLNLDATPELSVQVSRGLLAIMVIFAVGLPINVVTGVRRGLQEVHISALLEIPQALLRVCVVAVAVRLDTPLWLLAALAMGTQLVAPAANWLMLLSEDRMAVSRRQVDRKVSRQILKSGALFLGLQVAVLIGYSSDTVIAARMFGAERVPDYSLPSQLALAGIGVIAMVISPLWGAYADAIARGDSSWARRNFRRSVGAAAALGTLAGAVYLVAAPSFIEWWSKGRVSPSMGITAGFAAWILLSSVGAALATFLNAVHVVRMQLTASLIMAVVNIVVSVLLARHVGVAGLIWGTVCAFSTCILVPYAVVFPRLLRELGGEAKQQPADR